MALGMRHQGFDDGAHEFFCEVRERIVQGNLNPLTDSVFDEQSRYAPELALLASDHAAYLRDLSKARICFVNVQRSDHPFDSWFEKVANTPFFKGPGQVDPIHFAPFRRRAPANRGHFHRKPFFCAFQGLGQGRYRKFIR